MKRLIISAGVFLATASVAWGFPPLNISNVTKDSVTLGNLDCDTRYEIRVREWRANNSGKFAWRDAIITEQRTASCTPPPPPPPADADNDGVPDAQDQCPNTPGPASNNGCPVTNPPPDVTTAPVDGGANYYGQFTNSLPTSPNYFPIGAWLRPVHDQSHVDDYKDFGVNVLVGLENPEFTNEALLRANNLKAFIQANERTRFNDVGSETAGWLLADEIDMFEGPSACNGSLQSIKNGLPADGRARYNNYGKGVLIWETDSEAACFVEAQELVSTDLYWFTDPNESTMTAPDYFPEAGQTISGATVKRAANYGYQVDRVRQLDAINGTRKPIWNFIELGWPFTESAAAGGRRIQPAELRAAVWHSIIAGARGIIYFDHNFGPGTPGSTIRGEGYEDNRVMAKSVNEQIQSLAPVLNSPTITSGVSATGPVRILGKLSNGTVYIFAGSKGTAGNATFTVPSGSSVEVVGEGRTIPIVGNQFTDNFANANAIHIYRIN